jgi:hypothetical protein
MSWKIWIAVSLTALMLIQMPFSGVAAPVPLQQSLSAVQQNGASHHQLPQYHQTAANSGRSDSASMSIAGGTTIRLNSTVIVSTGGAYGTTVAFGPISGLPPNYTVQNNSTEFIDSSGRTVAAENGVVSSNAYGILASFSVTLLGNLSEGPFTLSILSGSAAFQLTPAGISSKPSLNPEISLYPARQHTGGPVTIMVSGFPANFYAGYPVMDNTSVRQSSINTDNNGAGYVDLNIPDLPGGNYTIRFSNYMAIQGGGTIVPMMALVPSFGYAGQNVLTVLSGFPSDGTVYITWPGSSLNVSGKLNTLGKGLIAFVVPRSSNGSHEVYASSPRYETAYSNFSLNQTSILLSANQGSPGMPVSVTGTGFHPGDMVKLLVNGRVYGNVSAPVMTNGTSIFSLNVPARTAGKYNFRLESSSGLMSNSTFFTIRPLLISNPAIVRSGVTVLVSGYYFLPDSQVRLFWYSGGAVTTLVSGSNGSFSISVKVPGVPGGSELFGAQDAHGNNATPILFFMSPSISSSAKSGFIGGRVTLSGTGFLSGISVNILWDGINAGHTIQTNRSGSFATVFTIPAGSPGAYIISVNNTSAGQIVFTVLQRVPLTAYLPAIVLPLITGIAAAAFLWRKTRLR